MQKTPLSSRYAAPPNRLLSSSHVCFLFRFLLPVSGLLQPLPHLLSTPLVLARPPSSHHLLGHCPAIPFVHVRHQHQVRATLRAEGGGEQLGVFNAGFLSGGVLVIVSLVLLLAIVSRHADAVFERKLAGKPSPAAPKP
jgi:hypothetical protein